MVLCVPGGCRIRGDDYFLTDTGAMAVGLCQTRFDGGCSIFGEDGKLIRGRVTVEQDTNGIVRLVTQH